MIVLRRHKMFRIRRWISSIIVAAAVLSVAVTAVARAETSSITLTADRTEVTWGTSVGLSGDVIGIEAPAVVEIADAGGSVLATVETASDGSY